MEASYDEMHEMVYFVFTVLDFPRERLNASLIETLDERVTVPIQRVLLNIEDALKSGQVVMDFETLEGELLTSAADSTYFKTVDRGKDTDSVVNKKIFLGHTGGAMGGLAFGMILLGFIIGCVVYHFKMRNGVGRPTVQFLSFGSSGMKRMETPSMAFNNPLG